MEIILILRTTAAADPVEHVGVSISAASTVVHTTLSWRGRLLAIAERLTGIEGQVAVTLMLKLQMLAVLNIHLRLHVGRHRKWVLVLLLGLILKLKIRRILVEATINFFHCYVQLSEVGFLHRVPIELRRRAA